MDGRVGAFCWLKFDYGNGVSGEWCCPVGGPIRRNEARRMGSCDPGDGGGDGGGDLRSVGMNHLTFFGFSAFSHHCRIFFVYLLKRTL